MFSIHTDKIGDMAGVECEGRMVRSDAPSSYVMPLHHKQTQTSWYLISRKCTRSKVVVWACWYSCNAGPRTMMSN